MDRGIAVLCTSDASFVDSNVLVWLVIFGPGWDCVDCIGNASYITKLDLFQGHWQVPLTDRDKEF